MTGLNYFGTFGGYGGGVINQQINYTGVQGTFTPDIPSLMARNKVLEAQVATLTVEIETLKKANLSLSQIIES